MTAPKTWPASIKNGYAESTLYGVILLALTFCGVALHAAPFNGGGGSCHKTLNWAIKTLLASVKKEPTQPTSLNKGHAALTPPKGGCWRPGMWRLINYMPSSPRYFCSEGFFKARGTLPLSPLTTTTAADLSAYTGRKRPPASVNWRLSVIVVNIHCPSVVFDGNRCTVSGLAE